MNLFIIGIGFALLTTAFLAMPNIPPIDPYVAEIGDTVLEFMSQAYFILAYLFSPLLLGFALGSAIVIMFFDQIYHGIMWILRKIPVLGIN